MRKFAVPYNGEEPEVFLEKINPYREYIESFYLGVPSLIGNHLNHIVVDKDFNAVLAHENNCLKFLQLTKGRYKRIITINSAAYDMDDITMQMFLVTKVAPFVDQFGVDGFILSDFNMAKQMHEWFPHLELHTSCNNFQWNEKTMKYWQEECGITTFNPPREILRTPQILKNMKEAGFKLKCIVNEACVFGCPQMLNHCVNVGKGNFNVKPFCTYMHEKNVLKCNWVLPRWLKHLDEYVDVYKIVDRTMSTDQIVYILDAYVNERDDCNLIDIISARFTDRLANQHINIPLNAIPDKLLVCECKECDTCGVCDRVWNDIIVQKEK